jgi:hypothetical protein
MDALRNGNFNSSEIVALTDLGQRDMTPEELAARPKTGEGSRTKTAPERDGFGDKAMTFIHECNMERRLNKSVSTEATARALSWGRLLEVYLHSKLGTNYEYFSDVTHQHPAISYWVGTADFKNHKVTDSRPTAKAIVDSKCPWTPKSFCQLVDPWYAGKRGMEYWDAIRNGWTDSKGDRHKKHDDAEKYFWQITSNSCIYNCTDGELIVYMPYKSDLDDIRTLASKMGADSEFFWIWNQTDDQLPHLVNDGYYKDINIFRFEIPVETKIFLHKRVVLAGKKLIEYQPIAIPA